MTFIFSSPEELEEKINAAIDEAEKRASARLLPRERIGKLVEAVATTPYGVAAGNGGHVSRSYRYRAETSYLEVAWYTRKGKKLIVLSAYRAEAHAVQYGSSGYISIHPNEKWEAFKRVYPDKAQKIREWLHQREIRKAIRHLPEPPVKIRDVQPDIGGLVKATTEDYEYYVGTPAGWIRTPYQNGDKKRSAWTILARMGFPVPRRKADRKWTEELTAAAVLHVLGGENA